jgi:hypothetical protein
MAIPFVAEIVPLAMDADGVIRVGRTRVTLDMVCVLACLHAVSIKNNS